MYLHVPKIIITTFLKKSIRPVLDFWASRTLPNSESYEGGGAKRKCIF